MTNQPLTTQRQKVLDVLRVHRGAIGAYDIAAKLAGTSGRQIAPITVYRALDYLCAKGLAHKLASRNAYMACHQHGHAHELDGSIAFLICTSCARVSEIDNASLSHLLTQLCSNQTFTPSTMSLEISGLCKACALSLP